MKNHQAILLLSVPEIGSSRQFRKLRGIRNKLNIDLPALETTRRTHNIAVRLKLMVKLPIRKTFGDRDLWRYADSASSVPRGPVAGERIPASRTATE